VELYNTDGAQGAARGAGIGAGLYTPSTAFGGLQSVRAVEPNARPRPIYEEAYERWRAALRKTLSE